MALNFQLQPEQKLKQYFSEEKQNDRAHIHPQRKKDKARDKGLNLALESNFSAREWFDSIPSNFAWIKHDAHIQRPLLKIRLLNPKKRKLFRRVKS